MEKMWSGFLRCFSLIFVISVIIYSTNGSDNVNGYDFQAFMDDTQNPCTNFYGYACGNWQHTLQETRGEFRDLEGYMNLQYIELLANLFEKLLQVQAVEISVINKKAMEYYESCRKTLNLEVFQYVNALKAKHTDLNWLDVLHNTNITLTDENWNWVKVLGRLRSYGFNNALLSMSVIRINATSSIIRFHKPENTKFDSMEQLVLEPLEPVLKLNITNFQQQLETAGKAQESKKSDNKGLTDFKSNFFNEEIKEYFEMLPKAVDSKKVNFKIEDINYIETLEKIIAETPPAVVAYYVGMKFVTYLRQEMPNGTESVDCLSPIKSQMPELLNFIYSEQVFNKQRERILEILNNIFQRIKIVYLLVISEHATHLEDEALRFLQQKLISMQLNIGQVPISVDIDFYDNYSNNWDVITKEFDSFYRNHLNIMRFRVFKQLELIDINAYEPRYIFYEHKPAPCFDRHANLVVYPFSLLRKPIFDPDDDELFDYAGIASIMAHDMSHALDPTGLKFDKAGNASDLFNKILTNDKHFQEALKCLHKHPTTRLNEKICDFTGSRVAYGAYFQKGHESNELKPPRNMTRKQVFFVKFSQFYCVTDVQTFNEEPMKYLSQIVQNNEEFFDAFHCEKPTSYESCHFW